MKLVLLPGMDGTGILFGPLLNGLVGVDVEVIPLPDEGDQDYASLAEYVACSIGDQECIVLAESYSGGIVEALLNKHNMNIWHVIFVASFLSSPSRILSRVAALLPIRALVSIPLLAPIALKALMLGWSASPETIALFRKAIDMVYPHTLKARLCNITNYRSSASIFEINATYIYPTSDILVSDRSAEFKAAFPNLRVIQVKGPHFILQAEPEVCAKHILAAVGHLTSKGNGLPSVPQL